MWRSATKRSTAGSRTPRSPNGAPIPPSTSLPTKHSSRPGAQQQRGPSHPNAVASTAKFPRSSFLASAKRSRSTRDQLPRSPLAARDDNIPRLGQKSCRDEGAAGSKVLQRRSAISSRVRPDPTPRYSGPRTPSNARTRRGEPFPASARGVAGINSSDAGSENAKPTAAVAAGAASVVSLVDTRQAEQKFLAAFKTTPKPRRTPPGGASRSSSDAVSENAKPNTAVGAGAASVVSPVDTRQAEQEILAAFKMTPKLRRTPPGGASRSSSDAGSENAKPTTAVGAGAASVVSPVDTRQAEQEILAAFKMTPKLRRTPPGGASRSSSDAGSENAKPTTAVGAGAASVVSPVDTRQAEQEILAAFKMTPKLRRTPPGGASRSSSDAGSDNAKPNTAVGAGATSVVSPIDTRQAEQEILAAFKMTPKPRRTPPGGASRSSSDAGSENAKPKTAVGARAAPVVSLVDTRQAEQEILAAFKMTPKPRRTPPGGASRSSSDAGSENAKPKTAVGARAASVVSLVDTRQAEQEILAAFKMTPKLRRTPPGGASRSSSDAGSENAKPNTAAGAGAASVVSLVDTRQAEQEILAAFKMTPKLRRTPPGGASRSSSDAGSENAKPNTAVGAGAAPVVSLVDTRQAEQEILAAFKTTPKLRRTPPGGASRIDKAPSACGRTEGRSCVRGPTPTAVTTPPRVSPETAGMTHHADSNCQAEAEASAATKASTSSSAYRDLHGVARGEVGSPSVGPRRTKPLITREGTGTASVASPLDTGQAEEEILAAFSRTPKVRRTPPGGLGNGRILTRSVVAVPRVALERTEVTEQQGSGESDTDLARLAVAAVAQAEATRAHARTHAVAAMIAESKAEKVPASQPGAESQPRNDDSDATLPRTQGGVDIQRPRKSWAERKQILALRRGNKLPITFPQTNGGKSSVNSERQALPMKHQPELAARRESKGAERRAMGESSVDSVRGASTRVEGEVFVKNKGREDGREHTTVAMAACGRSDINGRQQQDHLPRFSPTRPEKVAAGKNRFEDRAEPSTALAGGGSPCRLASPSSSVESADNAANINLRILEESAPTEEPFCGATVGLLGSKMTPAMFKGLVEGMITPSTGTERSDCSAGNVQAMKLLDLGSAQPPKAKINPAGSSKLSAPFPLAASVLARRIDMGGSVRYSSSSVEAAAAAKRAAANKSKTNKAENRKTLANDNRGACSSDARSSAGNIEAVAKTGEIKASGKAGPPSGAATEEATCYAAEASHVGVNASRQSSRALPRAGGDRPGDAGAAPQGGQEPSGDVAGVAGIDSFLRSPVARASPAEAISGCSQGVEVDDATVLGGGSSSSSSHPVAATAPAQDGCDQDARPLPEMVVVSDPFARTSEIPRTPVEQAASSLLEGEGGGGRDGGAARVEGGDQDVLLPGDLRTAHQQIGELRREMACLTDRVAKQTDERKRLAEVAFKAQDEAAGLRKQLRELEQKKQDKERETHANAGTADDGVPRLDGEVGFHRHAGTGEAAQEVMPSGRELEQELEVRAAQEETRYAKVALEAARAKIREFSLKVEEMERARSEEQLRWARERFEQDEKAIEENQRKMKLFISRTQAEDLAEVLAKDEEEVEQSLHATVEALAGKSRVMLEEFKAQNKRMAAQIDCLRESVKEREHRISEMMEKWTRLEESVRLANGETLEARQQLLEAEERLGELESECREALCEQTHLRERVATEEARCVSLEKQLSEARRSGEEMADMERSRRQSVEQRLGEAERARDELVAAAAESADSAPRAAAKAERDRRLVERKLGEAVRARDELSETVAGTAAAAPMAAERVATEEARCISLEEQLSEARRSGEEMADMERSRRQSVEQRLGAAERARDELVAAAAEAADSALQAAAKAERDQQLMERRLGETVRARDELSMTVARTAAAAATAMAAMASAGSTAPVERGVSLGAKANDQLSPPTLSDVSEARDDIVAKESSKADDRAMGSNADFHSDGEGPDAGAFAASDVDVITAPDADAVAAPDADVHGAAAAAENTVEGVAAYIAGPVHEPWRASSKADDQAMGSNADFHSDGEGPDVEAFAASDVDVITAPDADAVTAPDADVHGAAAAAENTVEGVAAYIAGPVHEPWRASNRAHSSGNDRSVDSSPQRETLGRTTESVGLPKPADEECSQSTKTSSLGNPEAAGANAIRRKLRKRPKVSYAEGEADSESSGGEGVVVGRARRRSRAPTRPRIPARSDGAPSSRVLVESSEASVNEDAENQPWEKPQAHVPHVRKEASAGGDLVGKISVMMDVNSDCNGLLESTGEAEDHADARLVETRTSGVKKLRRATKAGDRERGFEGENTDNGAAASHPARRSSKRDKSAQSRASSSAAAAVRSSEASPVEGEKNERENDAEETAPCREEPIARGQGKKVDRAGEDGGSSRGKVRSVRHKVAKSLTASTPEGRQGSAVEEDPCKVSSVSQGMGTIRDQINSTSEGDRTKDKESAVRCGTSPTRHGHGSKSGEDLVAGELNQSVGSRGEALCPTALTDETNARALPRKGAAPQKRRPPVRKVRGKACSDAVAAGAKAVTNANAANAGADPDGDAAEFSDACTGFDKTTTVEGARRPSKRAHSGDCDDIGDEGGSSSALSQVTDSAKRLGTTKLTGREGRGQAPIPSTLEEDGARVPPAAFAPVGEAGTRRKLRKRSKVNYTEDDVDSERFDGQVGARRPRSRGRSSARAPARVPEISEGARSRRFLASESNVERDKRSPRKGTPVRAPRGRKETSAGGGNVGRKSTTMNVDSDSGGRLESPGDTGDFADARAFEAPAPVAASEAVSKKMRKLGRVTNADHPEGGLDGHGDSAAGTRLARRSTRSNRSARSHLPPAAAATPLPEASPVERGVGKDKEEVKTAPYRKELARKGRDSKKAAGKGGDDVGSRGKVQARGGRGRAAKSVMAPTPDIDQSSSAIEDARDVTAAIREERETTGSQSVSTTDGGSARTEDAAARLLETSSAKQNLGSNADEDTIRDREDSDTEGGVSEHSKEQSSGMPLVATALVDRTNARESLRIETTIQEGRPVEAEDFGKPRAGINGTSRALGEPEQEVDPLPEGVYRSGLGEASTSFAAPPAQKRPRKLLGGGASRCKTPKGKRMSKDKVDSITADVAAPKGQAADTRSSEVTVKVGVGPRSGRKASLGRQSAADCGPSAAAGVSSRAGGGSDASVRGVGGTANPALKTKRRSTASILAMRGKPPIRGSLFQGFLDPRKGFVVPKLKPGASRP